MSGLNGKRRTTEMTKQELKELLTPEFLSVLHTAVECCNWDTDMVVTMQFCDWCHRVAGQPESKYNTSFEFDE